jgi:hypothetical protein
MMSAIWGSERGFLRVAKCRSVGRLIVAGALCLAAVVPAGGQEAGARGEPTIQLWQRTEVQQGGEGRFEVKLGPAQMRLPITIRIRRDVGTGAAVFEDGSTEKTIYGSQELRVRGRVASDMPGGLSLSAWREGDGMPAATIFFEVLPGTPEPRIYYRGRDITGQTEEVAAGQQIQLTVVLHPGAAVRKQEWEIGEPGESVGGFLHTPLRGGPQPVVHTGPTTTFYWKTRGTGKKVTYRLTMTDGKEVTATAWFDVTGPAQVRIDSEAEELVVGPSGSGQTSYMGFRGTGVTFHASYQLEPELRKNFIWVQLISLDRVVVTDSEGTMVCSPKAQPFANSSAGLDTNYPYDTRNPTHDSPPVELTDDAVEVTRSLRARIFLLWNSGKSNAIPVPLGYVAWHVSGRAQRRGEKQWRLEEGEAGPDQPMQGFHASATYPLWENLVPYSGVLLCE